MRIFTLLIGLFLTLSVSGQIQFENPNWTEVLAKAKQENKIIFVEGYASWCAPCKWMAKEVFTDPKVADFYNHNFINVKFDIESLDATDFVYQYGSLGVPTLYYIDPNGTLVHQIRGAAKVNKFIEIGKDALNPETQLLTLKRKFENGVSTDSDLRNYLEALIKTGKEDNDNVLAKYLPGKDLTKPEIMKVLFANSNPTMNSQYFKQINSNRQSYYDLIGKKIVINKLERAAINDGQAQEIDPTDQNAIKAHFSNYFDESDLGLIVDRTYLENLMYTYDEAEKILLVYEAQGILESEPDFGTEFYADIAKRFLNLYPNNSDALSSALRWAEIAIDGKQSYNNVVTKALILHKLNRNSEALDIAIKAMDLGTASGYNTYQAQELLKVLK